MPLTIEFDNSYAALPERFHAKLHPTPVRGPELMLLNAPLARELGLTVEDLSGPDGVAMLAGNRMPEGAEPLAQAYAGHQFGNFVPQLGDGRAILLGEVTDRNGQRQDIQLKGSGPTPFSRMGDGRAWLGPVLREFLVSEAMHAMGVPTTRALAAVTTGETVLREAPFPGAVLTRVAPSHIRVGTFQYFAARQDLEALQTLSDHVIARHYPDAGSALELLDGVVGAQAKLIAQWMALGFIHGVMNTDNAHVAGITIDYGPCAFMDSYHPATVFSSIDRGGRYAFARQPEMAVWNMAQFATALLPIIDADLDRAVEAATEVVQSFPDRFAQAWTAAYRAKLGLTGPERDDVALIEDLLRQMAEDGEDFTNTFRALSEDTAPRDHFTDREKFDAWHGRWLHRLAEQDGGATTARATMAAVNPAIIPRNHRIEEAIQAALSNDLGPAKRLQQALATPFDLAPESSDLTRPPANEERVLQTFCGT